MLLVYVLATAACAFTLGWVSGIKRANSKDTKRLDRFEKGLFITANHTRVRGIWRYNYKCTDNYTGKVYEASSMREAIDEAIKDEARSIG